MNKLLAFLLLVLSFAQGARAEPDSLSGAGVLTLGTNPQSAPSAAASPAAGKQAARQPAAKKQQTEIYATKEATFDANARVGTFVGDVRIIDPQFMLSADKVIAYMNKAEGGLEKAEAIGHVTIYQEKTDPDGGAPTVSTGKAEKAVYTAKTGDVELIGMPQVQQGPNLHVATDPATRMILSRSKTLKTFGASRTEINESRSEDATGNSPVGTGNTRGNKNAVQ